MLVMHNARRPVPRTGAGALLPPTLAFLHNTYRGPVMASPYSERSYLVEWRSQALGVAMAWRRRHVIWDEERCVGPGRGGPTPLGLQTICQSKFWNS